ncbi:MAG: pilus assembly protein TadG-related protein, partial [Acidimicrobiales bacterium]
MSLLRFVQRVLEDRRQGADAEGGYVLVMMAIMFVLLMMFAGYSVDVGNWNVHRNETQTAAEAAALGGVAFLPDDFVTAKLTAEQIAMNHGYALTSVNVTLGGGSNQLKVTITEEVSNYFLRVMGNDSTTISNTALAEFEQPVEMGSPEFILGNDPETGLSSDYWLSIASRNVRKDLGDRFATRRCYAGTANCSGTWNSEYDSSGYKYAVTVTDTTQPLRIQIFDPEWAWTGSTC